LAPGALKSLVSLPATDYPYRMPPFESLRALEALPPLVERVMAGLAVPSRRRRPVAGGFAPVEQAWHLADLELEGYGVRIGRLLEEERPHLPDFDGDGVALERRYLGLDAIQGARRFASARAANLGRLRALPAEAWGRGGTQEGEGPLALRDLPGMMLRHDLAHAAELVQLLEELAPDHQVLPDLRAFTAVAPPGSSRAA
jgi:hypothetical protein